MPSRTIFIFIPFKIEKIIVDLDQNWAKFNAFRSTALNKTSSPLNDGMLAGAEEEVEEDGCGAAGPQQLGGHVGEGWQGAGPAVLTPALTHHPPHHPTRTG